MITDLFFCISHLLDSGNARYAHDVLRARREALHTQAAFNLLEKAVRAAVTAESGVPDAERYRLDSGEMLARAGAYLADGDGSYPDSRSD